MRRAKAVVGVAESISEDVFERSIERSRRTWEVVEESVTSCQSQRLGTNTKYRADSPGVRRWMLEELTNIYLAVRSVRVR